MLAVMVARNPHWIIRAKIHSLQNYVFGMSSPKCCPIKFGTVVNDEGMVIDLPCSGKDCAWFFEDGCSIRIIAKELSNSQDKNYHKRMSAE